MYIGYVITNYIENNGVRLDFRLGNNRPHPSPHEKEGAEGWKGPLQILVRRYPQPIAETDPPPHQHRSGQYSYTTLRRPLRPV